MFAGLVVACFAAFAVTQSLKHAPTDVQGIELSPPLFTPGAQSAGVEHISFRIEHDDRVRVTVIDSQGNTVKTLARDLPLKRYRRVYFTWNGHMAGRRVAPAGTYRIRVVLVREKHEVLSPGSFDVKASRG